jgi:hypothetical protein
MPSVAVQASPAQEVLTQRFNQRLVRNLSLSPEQEQVISGIIGFPADRERRRPVGVPGKKAVQIPSLQLYLTRFSTVNVCNIRSHARHRKRGEPRIL